MAFQKVLIIVDVQTDFCRHGSLQVPDADEIVPLVNQLQNYFDLVIASKDWHPYNHASFAINHPGRLVGDIIRVGSFEQILWPVHCVQHSKGADFHNQLNVQKIKKIFYKGIDPTIDSYSAFYDNAHLRSTGLAEYLQSKQVEDVYVIGLAIDYCVRYSLLDAVKLGFNCYLIEDACRGVELKLGDIAGALEEMIKAGVHVIHSTEILSTS